MAALDVDLLVVGADPIGLFGACEAVRRGLSVAVVDSLPHAGGTMHALDPRRRIEIGSGLPSVRLCDLTARLLTRLDGTRSCLLLGHRADTLTRLPDRGNGAPTFVVATDRGRQVRCGALLMTNGEGNVTLRGVGRPAYVDRYPSYWAPEPSLLAGTDVVIAGDGGSAQEWACALQEVANSVVVLCRADLQPSRTTDSGSPVQTLSRMRIERVEGRDRVCGIVVEHEPTGDSWSLPCQTLVVCLGTAAWIPTTWGFDARDRRRLAVDECMSTEIRGVFAAGVAAAAGPSPTLGVGLIEAATAVANAAAVLDPATALESMLEGLASDLAAARFADEG